MSRERLYLFDTTLRDGAQTQGVDFSVEDKRQIALALDGLGIEYIEGGWPGANPTDTAFFAERPPLKRARFTAFGMTKRAGRSAANDPGLSMILDAAADDRQAAITHDRLESAARRRISELPRGPVGVQQPLFDGSHAGKVVDRGGQPALGLID